ncbi:MAG: DUF2786 domain-containing protein [Acidimicrobiales bacterium]
MGQNNKQRRKLKAKERHQRRDRERRQRAAADPLGGADEAQLDDDQSGFEDVQAEERLAAELIERDQWARATGDRVRRRQVAVLLDQLIPEVVAAELEARLADAVARAWALGWLPGEVLRQCRRSISAHAEQLAAVALAADHARRYGTTLHPRWQRHVERLGLAEMPGWGWLAKMPPLAPSVDPPPWPDVVELGGAVLFELTQLRQVGPVIPPPGSPGALDRSMVDLAGQEASPAMTRVRRLLAKAESTTYEAEAEACMAKAQELMVRHAIDEAMLWAEAPSAANPTAVRLPVDDPYARAKASLVTVVAGAARCRAVIDVEYGLVTVIGFDHDLIWCETLYTSLLVQAQREMHRAGRGEPAGGRRRSRGFRSSFLSAYTFRVGQRLSEVTAEVERRWTDDRPPSGQGPSGSLVPVLADRKRAVDEAVEASFGSLRSLRSSGGTDPQGWHAGRHAADRADLSRPQVRPDGRSSPPRGELRGLV